MNDITFQFRNFADFLEALESEDLRIDDITLSDGDLTADLTMDVQLPEQTRTQDIEFIPERVGLTDNDRVAINGTVRVSNRSSGTSNSQMGDADSETGSNPNDVPSYRDPEQLRTVYERCDTFEEMTDALGVYVTPETVRRHMIEHGIHQPRSRETSDSNSDSKNGIRLDDEEGVLENGNSENSENDRETGSDDGEQRTRQGGNPGQNENTAAETPENNGLKSIEDDVEIKSFLKEDTELPEDVTLNDIWESVQTAHTLYEVQQELGMDRDRARQLMKELNLLDVVTGRLAHTDREISSEELVDRIRTAAFET